MTLRTLRRRWVVLVLLVPLLGTALAAFAYLQHPKFGATAEGQRLAAVRASPHFVDGEFRNTVPTPIFTGDASLMSVLWSNLRGRPDDIAPRGEIPSLKTALTELDPTEDVVVWLGHSSFFVQLGGRRILVDPVFSASAGPLPFMNRAFPGSTPYTADDMPPVDAVLISHDHWDHLDHDSLTALAPRVRRVVVGLGLGATLERWGYQHNQIVEADWDTNLDLGEGLTVHVLPARHYSGRLLGRNQTLWVGFAVQTAQRRLFFSGDSGFGPHLAEIGERLGGFDLAVLDVGQYDERWAHIHMTPDEAVRASEALRAKALLPGHLGRFALAQHAWDDPLRRLVQASEGRPFTLLTPRIGEPLRLRVADHAFPRWWEGVD